MLCTSRPTNKSRKEERKKSEKKREEAEELSFLIYSSFIYLFDSICACILWSLGVEVSCCYFRSDLLLWFLFLSSDVFSNAAPDTVVTKSSYFAWLSPHFVCHSGLPTGSGFLVSHPKRLPTTPSFSYFLFFQILFYVVRHKHFSSRWTIKDSCNGRVCRTPTKGDWRETGK